MARRKLNTIKFPDIEDVYYLDADKVEFDDSATYADGSVGKALVNKANIDGYYDELTAGSAEQLISSQLVEDSEPYKFRTTGGSADVGNREQVDAIVGGTIAWNQLCNDASVTVPNNHKYIMSKGGVSSMGISTGSAITGLTSGTDVVHDLTQMFGSSVADAVYNMEQGNAGTGVKWFKSLFPNDYYAYNAGELISVSGLQSHDTVGFNQFDISTAIDNEFISDTGAVVSYGEFARSDYIKVLPNTNYYTNASASGRLPTIALYDAEKSFLGKAKANGVDIASPTVFNTGEAHFIIVSTLKAEQGIEGLVVNLSWSGWRNGEYEPYQKHSYPLDSSLTLRGVPKLSADNTMYYDGDTYESDGTVTRKYGTRAYQSGDESLANAITDGTNTVYKLTDETTETAEPYTKIQTCDDFGTEEYVSTSIVPVGHNTEYPANLRDKLQHLPDLADNDGYYMIKQASKQMSLEPFRIPKAPSENGTYVLKATVSGGTPTYTWVEEN